MLTPTQTVLRLVLSMSAPVAAGNQPTLEETQSWLRGNLTQVLHSESEGQTVLRMLSVEFPGDCDLVLTDQVIADGRKTTRGTYEVRLEALDPAHHREGLLMPGVWQLDVPTRGGESAVLACHGEGCEIEAAQNSIFFLFDNPDMPARASKALSHAIRLCGGEDDLF